MSRNIHILFDANSLIGSKSGVGQFSERLLQSIAEQGKNSHITGYYFNFLGLKKNIILPESNNIDYKVIRFLPTKLLSILHRIKLQLPLEFFINTKNFDFIIFPNFVAIPNIRKIPYAVAVHDLTFEDCPEYLPSGNLAYLINFVGKSVKNSSLLITISEFTKKRLISKYGNDISNKSIVIPLPYEAKENNGVISDNIKDIANKPFLLFVGTIEPRKNISNMVKAFDNLPANILEKYQLILAGGNGWKNEKIYHDIENVKKAKITLTGYISDSERDFLYKKTSAVCLISFYEGFGIPILEAFNYKKPVLLSSIDVFREVAGDQATYCNPNDIQSITKGLEKVLKAKAPMPIKINSWEDNAQKIINSIEEIIK